MALLKITTINPRFWRVTFNDPPMNLLTAEMYEELWSLLNDLKTNPDVKVVVFDSSATDYFMMHVDMVKASKALRQPDKSWALIASIRGRVRGIGSEFVLSCDMRFGSIERAILGQPEVGAGVILGGSGLDWLPRVVGRSRALEICLGVDDFDAKNAELYGYINRALPDAESDAFVDRLAHRIASFPKFPLAQTKFMVNNRAGVPNPLHIRQTQEVFMQDVADPETKEHIPKLFAAGLQKDGEFELNLGENLGNLDIKI